MSSSRALLEVPRYRRCGAPDRQRVSCRLPAQLADRPEVVITVADLGEFGLIAAIQAVLPAGDDVLIGPGDDAALIRAPDRRVVATTDLLIEGCHFRRDWSTAFDIGRKAAAQSLADVAAMGARPTALLVGLASPGDVPVGWAMDLARGLAAESSQAGASVAGGDVSAAASIMLAITGLGDLGGRDPVTRGGARPGDRLAVAGVLGHSAAGLALLSAGYGTDPGTPGQVAPDTGPGTPSRAGHDTRAGGPGLAGHDTGQGRPGRPGEEAGPGMPGGAGVGSGGAAADRDAGAPLAGLLDAHRRPRPPYAAGPEAARLGATSMIDISDGLLADLGHVAEASGVQIGVDTGRLAADPALRAAAAVTGGTWLDWVLTGGEDHALAATFPGPAELPPGWQVIGQVTEGSGVLVNGRRHRGRAGWTHFA